MSIRVSVIVPVLDDPRIGECLDALRGQTWPAEEMEILVVDNGSVDETRAVVRDRDVRLLVERGRRSPYAARNRGLDAARGPILAFTDADCVPDKDWIRAAVAALDREAADLVGGRVRFRTSQPPRAAEIVDSLHNLDNDRSIPARGAAKTGNLVAHRRVFDAIGRFDSRRRSGGDVEWTRRASAAGFTLVYAPDAAVEKHARPLGPLLRKLYRVGRGEIRLWRGEGRGREQASRAILRAFLPMRPGAFFALLGERAPEGWRGKRWRAWLTAWLCTSVQSLGRLHGLLVREGRR